jgi:hypothetical protein
MKPFHFLIISFCAVAFAACKKDMLEGETSILIGL